MVTPNTTGGAEVPCTDPSQARACDAPKPIEALQRLDRNAARPSGSDLADFVASGSAPYQQIVDYSRLASGARMVVLSRLDHERGIVNPLAVSLVPSPILERSLALARGLLPSFDLRTMAIPIDANPHSREVYERGIVASVTLHQLAKGAFDRRLIQVASAVAGLRYAFLCPVKWEGRVIGSLAFLTLRPLGEHQRLWCETLARQAALALENAHLLETLGGQIEELERSRQAIISTEEELRKELAELLHGRVQTRLLVAWHRLGQSERLLDVDPERARALLAQVREEIDEIREREVRQVSHLLHPSIIQVGLVPAIRSLVGTLDDQVKVTVHIAPEVSALDDPGHNRISEGLRLVAYRALEEALNNVYRHAQASAVEVSLGLIAEGRLELVVRDNGRGFDSRAVELGLGLNSIAARVGQAQGSWHITSAPGHGTTVSVELPLGDEEDGAGSRDGELTAGDGQPATLGDISITTSGERGAHGAAARIMEAVCSSVAQACPGAAR